MCVKDHKIDVNEATQAKKQQPVKLSRGPLSICMQQSTSNSNSDKIPLLTFSDTHDSVLQRQHAEETQKRAGPAQHAQAQMKQ